LLKTQAKMKKGLFLALALSLAGALACQGKDVKYEVKGSNAPKDGAKVFLVDQATMSPIDSAVVAGGAFSLKGMPMRTPSWRLLSMASKDRSPFQ
jgi:hypothetical protein